MTVPKQSRGRRSARAIVLLSVAALVASACGSSSKKADTTTTAAAASTTAAAATTTAAAATTTAAAATTTAAAASSTTAAGGGAATGDPVTIESLIDQTGPSPYPEGLDKVIKATVDYINSTGGLNGHVLKIEITDGKTDPANAQAVVDGFKAKNPVAVLLGTSASETAISDALGKLGVPIIGQGYNPAVWGGYFPPQATCKAAPTFCAKPNFLTIATTFGAVVAEQVVAAQLAGSKVVAAAACAEIEACSSAGPVFDGVAKALGLKTLGSTKVSSTATDYSAQCISFINGGADFIQISGSNTMGVNLQKSCADQGYKGAWGASAGSVNGSLIKAPYKLVGGLNGFPWWVDDAPVKNYRAVMDKAGVSPDVYGNPVSTGMYSALLLLQKAVNANADKSKPLDGAAALAAMYKVKDETLDGLLPQKTTFTADNLDRHVDCFWPYVKDEKGNFTNPLGGLKTQCFPAAA
jgi:branched-chain amino acid transport system substrate-binding protein